MYLKRKLGKGGMCGQVNKLTLTWAEFVITNVSLALVKVISLMGIKAFN